VSCWISREQVTRRLREAGFSFKRQADRVEIWKLAGDTKRVNVPRRDLLLDTHVRVIIGQAGLSPTLIDDFFKNAVKS
jgi:hypothetical protein